LNDEVRNGKHRLLRGDELPADVTKFHKKTSIKFKGAELRGATPKGAKFVLQSPSVEAILLRFGFNVKRQTFVKLFLKFFSNFSQCANVLFAVLRR
jgi:hypothetical protein